MPFLQIVAGLIFLDTCSDLSHWIFYGGDSSGGLIDSGIPQDPSSIGTWITTTNQVGPGQAYGWYQDYVNVGSGVGRQVHIYASLSVIGGVPEAGYAYGFQTPNTIIGELGNAGNTEGMVHVFGALSPLDVGLVLVKIANIWAQTNYYSETGQWISSSASAYVTHVVICQSNFLTLSGFAVGQKLEMYQQGTSNPTLVATTTVAANSTNAIFDLSNIFFPYQYFFKIYSTAGVLIETTALYTVCGGDTWDYAPIPGGLTASAQNFIIYQIGGSNPGIPQNTLVTATLIDQNGNPYPGATIQFSCDFGTLSSTSVLTDSTGRASVTYSSTENGIAVIQAKWGGDVNVPTVPAAIAFTPIHVWSSVEVPDSTQPYQFFCEGHEYVFTDGTYTLASGGVVGNFEVDMPVWDNTITLLGLCSFYRFGVKEFSGILTRVERTLSDTPTVKLLGVDVSWLLNTRAIDSTEVTGTPTSTLSYLLESYVSGITPGNLNLPPTIISFAFNTVQLLAALQQIMSSVQDVQYRVNANLTIDISNMLGNVSVAEFAEAETVGSPSKQINDSSLIANALHLGGGGTPRLTSLAYNPESIAEYGLLEGTDLQPSVTDQPTLDLIAAFDAAKDGFAGDSTELLLTDFYPTGTYGLYDYVSVTSPTLGLSGLYQVMQFTRTTLTNPYATQLELSARLPEVWQMDEPGKRIISQLGVTTVTEAVSMPLSVDNTLTVYAADQTTLTGTLTHVANVVVVVFVHGATYGTNNVTIGDIGAAHAGGTSGSDASLDVWYAVLPNAGADTVTVTLSGTAGLPAGFVAVSVKNSVSQQIDATGAGVSVAASPSTVSIAAGTQNRLILVGCSVYDSTGTTITLDSSLGPVGSWANGYDSLSVGGYVDNTGNTDTFSNSIAGLNGYASSFAIAVKP